MPRAPVPISAALLDDRRGIAGLDAGLEASSDEGDDGGADNQ